MENIDKLVSRIIEEGPDRIFLQIPEGLRPRLDDIQEKLGEEGIETFVSLEPCYGACDIRDGDASRLDCDLLVHVGHTGFCEDEEIDTLYFPWYYDRDPVPVLRDSHGVLEDYGSIGLVASINFLPALDEAERFLSSEGHEVFAGKGEKTERGQILGCDISGALSVEESVDCYLYIGSGVFHPLGLALQTDKPVFKLDFEKGEISELDFDRFQRQKIVAMEKARGAEEFGVLVSTKKGQMKTGLALDLKEKIKSIDRDAYILVMDEIRPEKLSGVKADCLVNTACPRVAVEHRTDFDQPVLNPGELEELLEKIGQK